MIRDSGRILSLKLCSLLTQLIVKLSKNIDTEKSCAEFTQATINLLKLMSYKMTNDRHRHVINQRLKEIQEKNVLQEFPQLSELFNYVMTGFLNIDQILQLP